MVRCASGVFFVRPARVNMYWRVAASKRSSWTFFFSCFGWPDCFLNLFAFLPFFALQLPSRSLGCRQHEGARRGGGVEEEQARHD